MMYTKEQFLEEIRKEFPVLKLSLLGLDTQVQLCDAAMRVVSPEDQERLRGKMEEWAVYDATIQHIDIEDESWKLWTTIYEAIQESSDEYWKTHERW